VATRIKIGLLDNGVAGEPAQRVVDVHDIVNAAKAPVVGNHGTAIATIIVALAPQASLYDARVFPEKGLATPAALAHGLDWLVEQDVELVNVSLGLRDDRDVLRTACARAAERGLLLIAAAPAQGPAIYPSAYPGVIRVTGDARCAPRDYAWLDTQQATFGACVGTMDHAPGRPGGGASYAVAHVTGELARLRTTGVTADGLVSQLRSQCAYFGPEKRQQ